MAKLTRYLQKIFANDSNRVGVFGTGVNKETSKNVETLQSADYENGWSAAIVTNKNYPIWQERDGVDYGLSYQIKYLDQMGMAEWIATETYYTTSYCQYNGMLYRSKIDNNINHTPLGFSDDYWQCLGRDFLNTQQVTNCLLEVPQRVKYTLVDGALTILAGSVIIVPYGTTDLSSTYPVGATFINDDLKVYDTYWDSTNSKFYVWAQLQADVVRAASAGGADGVRTLAVSFDSSTIATSNNITDGSVTSDSSMGDGIFYNITTNLVKTKTSGVLSNYTYSFPIMKTVTNSTYNVSAIKQVFNGFGYIGGVMWADKGIKYLIPNGRNADGSLNNIEYTFPALSVRDRSTLNDGNYTIHLTANIPGNEYHIGVFGDKANYYDAEKNYNFHLENNTVVIQELSNCGEINLESGKITRMTFNNALNLSEMCDGHWVSSGLELASSVTFPTSTNTEYDLTSYLPANGYAYEVLLDATVVTGSTSGNTVTLQVESDIILGPFPICSARTRANANTVGAGATIIPIGAARKLILKALSGAVGTYSMAVKGYRRIGLNY